MLLLGPAELLKQVHHLDARRAELFEQLSVWRQTNTLRQPPAG